MNKTINQNSIVSAMTNAALRRVESLFPGYFQGAKHNHYGDFGYPEHVTFEMLHHMYLRNSLARASVAKTMDKVWQDTPIIREDEEPHDETPIEKQLRQHMQQIRGWQMLKISNSRALVGGWAATILRFEDGERFNKPVNIGLGADPTFLAGMIPAWSGQLQVTDWDDDELSPTYGEPKMYHFNEAAVTNPSLANTTKISRQVEVHPDRVLVWSADGMPYGTSLLQPGYNDLLDIEKVNGAGGEAFWKNSKSGAVIEMDKELDLKELMNNMGVGSNEELVEAMNEQLDAYSKSIDKVMLLQGMTMKDNQIVLPSPEFFRKGPLENYAASIGIPVKVLVGMQTGERASTEDANEWSQTCMSRRSELTHPTVMQLANRLEKFGLIPESDWFVYQEDLTEATQSQRIENAKGMAEINSKSQELVFTPDEEREAAGYPPLTAAQKSEYDEDDGEDSDVNPDPPQEVEDEEEPKETDQSTEE